MDCFSPGRLCKLALARRLHAGKNLVFEKARRAERFGQMPLELANLTVLIGMINLWNRVAIGFHMQHPPAA